MMGEDERILAWVKERKKEFARKMIRDSGVEASEVPVAIFMAGLPGAGKTEFTKNLIKTSYLNVLRLDMDENASQIDTYQPKKADKFRKGASLLLSRTFDEAVKGKHSFIMDGNDNTMKTVRITSK